MGGACVYTKVAVKLLHKMSHANKDVHFGSSSLCLNMNWWLQSVINLRLMVDLTAPGPAVAPVLSIKTQKSLFLSATLPMDCVVRTTANDTVEG